jgi:hypothetical protein
MRLDIGTRGQTPPMGTAGGRGLGASPSPLNLNRGRGRGPGSVPDSGKSGAGTGASVSVPADFSIGSLSGLPPCHIRVRNEPWSRRGGCLAAPSVHPRIRGFCSPSKLRAAVLSAVGPRRPRAWPGLQSCTRGHSLSQHLPVAGSLIERRLIKPNRARDKTTLGLPRMNNELL